MLWEMGEVGCYLGHCTCPPWGQASKLWDGRRGREPGEQISK